MLPNVFVCGVNGVGKTTILKRVSQLRLDLDIIPGSAALMNYLGRPGDYEYLRSYPEDQALLKLNDMLNDLIDQHCDGGLIFDAHLLNIVRGRVKDVTPPTIHLFNAIVMIRGDVDSVYGRIQAEGRDRALFKPGSSPVQQYEMLKQYQLDYCEKFYSVAGDHIPVSPVPFTARIIQNSGDLDATVRDFLEFYGHDILMPNAP